MADIRRIKLPNGTTYNIKDNTARTNITNITNGNTKLPYGKALSITNVNELNLLDPNNNVLSTVNLPSSGISFYTATWTGGDSSNPRYTHFNLDSGKLADLKPGDIIKVAAAANTGYKYAESEENANFYTINYDDGTSLKTFISTWYATYLRYNKKVSSTYYFENITDYKTIKIPTVLDNTATLEDIKGEIISMLGYADYFTNGSGGFLPYNDNGSYVSGNGVITFGNKDKKISCFMYPNTTAPTTITHINSSSSDNEYFTPIGMTCRTGSNNPKLAESIGPIYYVKTDTYKTTGYFPAAQKSLPTQYVKNFMIVLQKIV